MDTAFYSNMRPAVGQTEAQIIKRARILGYTLVAFNGWDDADLGYPGNRGPRWAEARANAEKLRIIQDACVVHSAEGDDWPHIVQTAQLPTPRQLEDEDGLMIIQKFTA